MRTNPKFTVLRLLVLGVLAAGLNAMPASAQTFRGKFTLSSATRWGQVVLPAGDYSFTVDKELDNEVTVFRGTQSVARIKSVSMSHIKSGPSGMVLHYGAVGELSLPEIGVSLHYPTPTLGHGATPQEPQVAQTIAVVSAGAAR
jgi:hypothetical protein